MSISRRGKDQAWLYPCDALAGEEARCQANEIFDRMADVATAPTQDAAAGQWVGTVWASPEATTAIWDGLRATLVLKARNHAEFNLGLFGVVVADRLAYLGRPMTINSTGERVDQHTYASERNGESSIAWWTQQRPTTA